MLHILPLFRYTFSVDIIFLVIAIILLIVGFFGTFVPVLPGAPLAWAGLLAGFFSSYTSLSLLTLAVTGTFAILVSVLDNIFPVLLTKKFDGSKAATRGSTIGLIIGFFTGPWGIILGPFCGALIGELIHDSTNFKKALSVAWGAFLGFICGTGMKMITVLAFVWVFVISVMK